MSGFFAVSPTTWTAGASGMSWTTRSCATSDLGAGSSRMTLNCSRCSCRSGVFSTTDTFRQQSRRAARVSRAGGDYAPAVNAKPPVVELHVISDSTGETAARLVSALEAQFPDLDFEEIRFDRMLFEHPLDILREVRRHELPRRQVDRHGYGTNAATLPVA